MALPKTTQDRIIQQAEYYSDFNENEDHTPISKGKYYGYIAGGAAEAENAQAHNNKAFQELESIHKKYHDLNGDNPAANHMLNVAREYLQWNAEKEVKG